MSGWKTLATASSTDLLQRGARSDSLLLDGKVCGNQTANIRRDCDGFIALAIIRFAFKEKTVESFRCYGTTAWLTG